MVVTCEPRKGSCRGQIKGQSEVKYWIIHYFRPNYMKILVNVVKFGFHFKGIDIIHLFIPFLWWFPATSSRFWAEGVIFCCILSPFWANFNFFHYYLQIFDNMLLVDLIETSLKTDHISFAYYNKISEIESHWFVSYCGSKVIDP